MAADTSGPRPSKSLRSVRKGLEREYPGIVTALGQQATPMAEYEMTAQEAVAPREQELNASLFEQFAPRYAEGQAAAELGAIRGSGGQAVRESEALSREIDPEYYNTRAGAASKLSQLLGGLDPNQLTGAERENTARGLARSNYQNGELNAPSNQGAIDAALTYGSALNQKRNTVSNAINSAVGALPSFKANNNTFDQATGRSGSQAFQSQFGQAPNASVATGQANQGALGLTGGFQNLRANIAANHRDSLDRYNETTICCFIFMEAYNGKLPWFVRLYRDKWYSKYPNLRVGYKKMAKWLVPLMKKSKVVRYGVNELMIKPISRIGAFLSGESMEYSKVDLFLHNLWFKIWARR